MDNHDTVEGITARISDRSYASLYQLALDRSRAPSERKPAPLHVFVINGQFYFDSLGDCQPLDLAIFRDELREKMSLVMGGVQFHAFVRQESELGTIKNPHQLTLQNSHGFQLPPPHVVCARCGKAEWTFEKAHQIRCRRKREDVDLTPYAGKSFRQVFEILRAGTEADWETCDLAIRSLRWRGSQPGEDEEFCSPEQLGWRNSHSEDNPITWDYIVQAGDLADLVKIVFYDGPCYAEVLAEEHAAARAMMLRERQEVAEATLEAFVANGFDDCTVEMVPLPERLKVALEAELGAIEAEFGSGALGYARLKTKQGTVGLILGSVVPTIDLHGTSAKPADFGIDDSETKMELIPWRYDPATLLRLWQVMVKRAANVSKA